ncbi:hypothetical protein DEU56DRAFT_974220 [Suillus clintonianus]|uniref:uncharacterized protein n=1 Tax=Suillus clintonianus TaxID=1904413 RepID=UPI001B862A9A|nr:uncharacterized protein DEU56DRAFT_974220 [Suillus clintonianus]KAG2124603.1 hypothetical protein DEU56DRAFT_974220 [Suillus clintonianus]
MEGAAIHDDSTLGNSTSQTASLPTSDANLYDLPSHDIAFLKAQLGIDDDDDLKRHILEVQAKAREIAPYPWIRQFVFVQANISRNPGYEHVLKLGRERPDAVLLDVACCFGVDARRAAADGFPAKNIIASDKHIEFLQLSHDLFRTTPASFPAYFLPGDIFDEAFLSIAEPSDDVSPVSAIDFSLLKSLNSLHGRMSAINASRLFHLFDEEKQLYIARALAGLLSAQPGSIICGHQLGILEKGITLSTVPGFTHESFCHSPETWTSLWDGEVFEKGSVKVLTELTEIPNRGRILLVMRWSVIRL